MAAQTESSRKDSRSGVPIAAIVVILLLFLPLLYAFSIGPVVWFYDRGYISESSVPALEAFYFPLQSLTDLSSSARSCFESYVELWEEPQPAPWAAMPAATPLPAGMPLPAPTYVPPPVGAPAPVISPPVSPSPTTPPAGE